MIRLFVALCALFSLFTAVKTSDIKEIDVITVKRGEDVTMECNISVIKRDNVVWYRQISGKLPQYFAKPYKSELGYKFAPGFNDDRFSISVNDNKFDLNINKTREDDEGDYFCGEMDGSVVRFTSGTRLQFDEHNLIIPLIASNIFSVIVITLLLGVLYKNHRKDASSSNHQIPTNQTADDDDVLNYASVSFAKKPSSSRTSRAKSHEDVYAQVKIK
ncbi:uncharacterized protein LOC113647944 [Tachysurus ichikawai]